YLPEAGFIELCSAAAIVSFAASLPITVNGWGLREVASIYVFGQLGMQPGEAAAVSLLVGICSTTVVFLFAPTALRGQEHVQADSIKDSRPGISDAERLNIERSA